MPYADYEYYRLTYHGSLPEETFTRLARRASAYLDRVSFGRIREATEAVKDACCAVVEAMELNERGGGIASETNDGVSVSYVAGISNAKSEDRRLYDAAFLYLGGTGLLYRGCP